MKKGSEQKICKLTVWNMYKCIMLLARNKVLILTKTATCIKFEFPICQCHANSVNTLFPCGFRVRPVILGGAGGVMPPSPHILAVQLTLSQTGGPDYAHLITT